MCRYKGYLIQYRGDCWSVLSRDGVMVHYDTFEECMSHAETIC